MNFKGRGRPIGRSVVQRVDDIEVIFHRQVIHNERGPPGAWLDLYAVPINGNSPEQANIKTQIKVVDLIAEVGAGPMRLSAAASGLLQVSARFCWDENR